MPREVSRSLSEPASGARPRLSEPPRLGRQHAIVHAFRQALRGSPVGAAPPGILIEGPKLLGEALRSRLRIEAVLFTPSGWQQQGPRLGAQLSKHVSIGLVEDAVLRASVDVETPAGVAALARLPQIRLEDFWPETEPSPGLVVVAAGVQDPGNLGTLLRVAEAFGAQGSVSPKGGASPWRPKTIRASAGALFRLPALDGVEPDRWLEFCRSRQARLIASTPRSGRPPEEMDWSGRIALLVGSEGTGLPRALHRAAEPVSLPMRPQAESLNAGVAGAILLYLAGRHRNSL